MESQHNKDSVHPPHPFWGGGGGWASNQIFKTGGAWQDLNV